MILRSLRNHLTESAQRTAAAMIVAIGLATGLLGVTGFYSEVDDIEQLTLASSSILQHQINHSFLNIDDVLSDTASRIDIDAWPDSPLIPWLQGRMASFPEISAITLVKTNGYTTAGALTLQGLFGRSVDVTDRDYFKHHMNNPADSSLYIGAPMRNRLNGKPSIPVSKAIIAPNGRLKGIVLALVDPRALESAMLMMRTRGDIFNMLLKVDGTVLSRAPALDVATGQSVLTEPFFQQVRQSPLLGVGTFSSPLDGQQQILSYRSLGRYPLVVVQACPAGTP